MQLRIGNAPCSWGVEFADAPSNPPWEVLLDETRGAGYDGTELGPVGYMPESPALVRDSLAQRGLELTAGVVYQPFHDASAWAGLLDSLRRTCRILAPLRARHLVLIDSVSETRSAFAGDPQRAPRLRGEELAGLHRRVRSAATIAREDYGLSPAIHAHAGGFIEFEDELEQVLDAVDEDLLGVCLDTGHSLYAGFDPVAVLRRHSDRVSYVHLKDLDKAVLRQCVSERAGFYESCARGVFCNLGEGAMDFDALREALDEVGYTDWATVEQDRGPQSVRSSYGDAAANLAFLRGAGLAR